jgi:pimeloyl-ACP methyl ester carboxylesterase
VDARRALERRAASAVVAAAAGGLPGRAARHRTLVLVDIPLDPGGSGSIRSGVGFRPHPAAAVDDARRGRRGVPLVSRATATRRRRDRARRGALGAPEPDGTWTSKFDWRWFRGRDPEAPNPYRDFAAQLARIPCPTLIVRGERSSIQSVEDHRRCSRRSRRARRRDRGRRPQPARRAAGGDGRIRCSTSRAVARQNSGTRRRRDDGDRAGAVARRLPWH